jgi:hypothetical protein
MFSKDLLAVGLDFDPSSWKLGGTKECAVYQSSIHHCPKKGKLYWEEVPCHEGV